MKIVPITYQGSSLQFQDDGWFNATAAAEQFNRRIDVWLKTQETHDYLAALCEISNTTEKWYLKTKRGANGGTWLHPKLAVRFAQWLDPKFAVWCDMQIDALLRGKNDWRKERSHAAASFKVMTDIIKLTREEAGKPIAHHHFSNEARLINFILSGEFGSVDRDQLPQDELELLGFLEDRNSVLIARSVTYDKRKEMLGQYAADYRFSRRIKLVAV